MEIQQKVKILHLIDTDGLGGAQTLLRNHLLKASAYDEHVMYLRRKADSEYYTKRNFHYTQSKAKYSLKQLTEIRNWIYQWNPAIVHCHLSKSLILGILIKHKYPHIAVIHHEHGEVLERNSLNSLIYRMLLRAARKKLDRFVAVSPPVEQVLTKTIGISKNKLRLIENFFIPPANPEKYLPNNTQRRDETDKKTFYIGYAGRLSKTKNLDTLLYAATMLDFPFKLLIAGMGEDKKRLIQLAQKLNIKDKAIFTGYQQDIGSFYHLLDIYVQPSLSEAFGLSLFEAMSVGIPVIASDIPVHKYYLNNGKLGLIFKRGEGSDLAQKIKQLLNHQDIMARLKRNGPLKSRQYSYNAFRKNLHLLYDDMVYAQRLKAGFD